jgi:hypothetical protein
MIKTCFVIFLISFGGPNFHHPGTAQWNPDGTWTVNWAAVEEAARMPGPPNIETYTMARALLKDRAAGKLLESKTPECSVVR